MRPTLNFTVGADTENILLISCADDGGTGGGLCVVDGNALSVIDRISTAGLTVFDGRLARLLRTPISTGGGEILVYDACGVTHYLRVDELSDAHYMAWDGEHLITASTGNNSLLWIMLDGIVLRRWRAPGADDSWHLNDVCLVENRLYACAFGKYSDYRGYKTRLGSGDGFVFEVASGQVVVSGLCAPHNPRYFDHAWTVCDSLRESVVQLDAHTGLPRNQAQLRSFTRGLAITDDYVIVGESANRNQAGAPKTGSVAILRRSDFGFVTRFEVPFREVSDVVVAPATVLQGVKTGFRTNLLRVSESNQLQMFHDIGIEPKRLWAISERLANEQCKIQINAAIPDQFICGEVILVSCTVKNLAESFLCSELPHPVYLSYRWSVVGGSVSIDATEGIRTRLPCMLAPAASIDCRIEIRGPQTDGEFGLLITMVQEGVVWFSDVDLANSCSATVKAITARSILTAAQTSIET
jgi:hypothetical protein